MNGSLCRLAVSIYICLLRNHSIDIFYRGERGVIVNLIGVEVYIHQILWFFNTLEE